MKPLIWYAALYAAAAAFLRLVGIVPFLWLARTLPVQEYAGFGLLVALQSGITTFAIAGVVESVVGLVRADQAEQSERAAFAAANVVFLLMTVVSAGLAGSLYHLVSSVAGHSSGAFLYAIASGALLAFCSLQAQIVRLREDHLGSLCFSFLAPLAGLVGSVLGFLQQRTVAAFFLGNAAGVAATLLVLRYFNIGFYEKPGNGADVRAILLRVTPFVVVAFLGWLSGYGNNFLVGLMLAPADIAAFTFLLSVASSMQLVASALNQAWSPRFYRLARELPLVQVGTRNRAAFRLLGIAVGVAGALVMVAYPGAMRQLGGNLAAYAGMKPQLLLLFVGYLLLIPWWQCQNYYLVHGKGGDLMRVVLITSLLGTLSWVIFMWLLGPLGIYLGFLAQMLLRTVGMTRAAKREWPIIVAWDGVAAGALIMCAGFLL